MERLSEVRRAVPSPGASEPAPRTTKAPGLPEAPWGSVCSVCPLTGGRTAVGVIPARGILRRRQAGRIFLCPALPPCCRRASAGLPLEPLHDCPLFERAIHHPRRANSSAETTRP